MKEVEILQAVYEEKQAKYQALCDEAMADMHKAGEELLKAMQG